MFHPVALALFFFAALPIAAAAPSVMYKPATGEFWISGTQQPDGHVAIFLYSDSGRLIRSTTPFGAAYPLGQEGPEFPPFSQ